MHWLYAYQFSSVDISGGSVGYLSTSGSSTVNLHGRNFSLGDGLILYGDRVLGTGWLYGEWFDRTGWSTLIGYNAPTSTILAVPEPTTLLLLGLGAVMVRKRR
jgi:hypothetical protein